MEETPGNPPQRRCHPVAEASEWSIFGKLTASEFYARHSVEHSTSTFTSADGLKIFTQWWTPLPDRPTAGIVCVVHGYTSESSWLVQLTSVLFSSAGFAVCALDHRGHGFSEGLTVHVPDVRPVVDDCLSFFDSFRARYPPSLPCFLYGESLGGAIVLLTHLRDPGRRWDGIVVCCGMCGISEKYTKMPINLEPLLPLVAKVVPTWKVVPTRGTIPSVSYKVGWKRKLAEASPKCHGGWPRAATALELKRICGELQRRFEEVTAPLLVVHGAEDVLCDPGAVEELFRRASSRDKMIKMYDGMWHQLVGESDEDVDRVYGDVLDWLRSRAQPTGAVAEPGV